MSWREDWNTQSTKYKAHVFILPPSSLRSWPDPGLSRNTRCRCYRCSVPGLAGFTRLALCGARDLINHGLRFRSLACGSAEPEPKSKDQRPKTKLQRSISAFSGARAFEANRLLASVVARKK